MSTADRNYTNTEQSGIDSKAERVGDITGEPPTNEAMERNKASKLANLLEGLEFPATKEKIRNYLNSRSPSMGNRINDVVEAIENNLDDSREYGSTYDVEVAAGLVKKAESEKPYARDSGLNGANLEKVRESERQDPYSGRERISGASSRDVSPNTPKGEDV
ncbi:MAG TPA: hypothetical protein VI037_06140 [Nitrososphaera sp.]|jgi:hypothetical protein